MLRFNGDEAASDGIRYAGNPIKVSGMADPERGSMPPVLDADRAKILSRVRPRPWLSHRRRSSALAKAGSAGCPASGAIAH